MITNISTDRLQPHPNNPRKDLGELTELSSSIKENGILQNLTVIPADPELYKSKIASKKAYPGDYIIIIGHRRHAAAKLAGLSEIPCVITDMDEKTQVGTMLLENIQRNDLTVIEQAQGFQMMLDLGETTKTISEKTGFSETTVRKRLFVASLNEKKSKAAYERGATLDDYMKLEKINDVKTRNKVLETIGTNGFNNEYKKAIAEELRDKNLPKIIKEIETFAKPTDKLYWDLKGYEPLHNWSCGFEKYETSGKLSFNIPKKWEPDEYLYHTSLYSVDIYKKIKNAKIEKKMTELSTEEQTERRETRRKYKALKESGETTYRLRLDFVKSFSQRAVLNATQIEGISNLAFTAVCLGEKFDFSLYSLLAGFEKEYDWRMGFTQKRELKEKSNAPAASVLLMSLYSMLKDNAENTYFYGAESSAEQRGQYKKNDKLDAIYNCICALGYQMSDEEKSLQDGTHELFKGGE